MKTNKNQVKNEIKILPAITTTYGSDWRKKIREIDELGIEEIALFPTALGKTERKELYGLIENSRLMSIPFVHLRSDMEPPELEYLAGKFGTKVFNIHTGREYAFPDYADYNKIIFIENCFFPFDEEELRQFGGICVDLSHLETNRLENKSIYEHNIKVMKKFAIGCNHVSAIRKETWIDNDNKDFPGFVRHDYHRLENLSELDFLKKYPVKFFAPFIAIELENNMKEQLIIKSCIENILKGLNEYGKADF